MKNYCIDCVFFNQDTQECAPILVDEFDSQDFVMKTPNIEVRILDTCKCAERNVHGCCVFYTVNGTQYKGKTCRYSDRRKRG